MLLTSRSSLVPLLVIAVYPGLAWSQAQSVRPGINEYYQDPDFQVWAQRFESAGREVFDQRHAIVSALDLQPGMIVADIGAGTGLFTLLFAPQVGPGGRVLAVDISKVFMTNVARRATEQGYANVQTIVSTQRDTRLPPRSIDIAFLCDTYHHFEYPQDMLASIRHAIKPGGSLVVIDYRKDPDISTDWVMGHVRANEVAVIGEIEAAGFELLNTHDWLRDNYFLHFRRAELDGSKPN